MKCTNPIILFTLATFAACNLAGTLSAQNLDSFKKQIATPDPSNNATVRIQEHNAAESVVRSLQVQPTGAKIKGYRVCIFVGNTQNARNEAQSAVTKFKELNPGVPVTMYYENPDWKVTVGNCLTSEEAIILWGKIKSNFDRAFITRREIPLSLIGENQGMPADSAQNTPTPEE